MHLDEIHRWQHVHTFGTDVRHPGERQTHRVIALTASMMAIDMPG